MGEDKTERRRLFSGGGGDVAVAEAVDVAVFVPLGGGAEDEIGGAGDVAILEEMPTAIAQDRVLPAEEVAIAKRRPIAIDANRQRLPDPAGGVFERQVFAGEIVGIDVNRRRAEGTDDVP